MNKELLQRLFSLPAIQLLLWIFIIQFLGILSSSLSAPGPWYAQLNKSSLTPSNWVFPVAWTTIYTCIAIFGWSIFHYYDAPSNLKNAFFLHMFFNYTWSIIFFNAHLISLALLSIFLMIILVIYMIILSFQQKIHSWILLVPCLLWLFFACYLTGYILSAN